MPGVLGVVCLFVWCSGGGFEVPFLGRVSLLKTAIGFLGPFLEEASSEIRGVDRGVWNCSLHKDWLLGSLE